MSPCMDANGKREWSKRRASQFSETFFDAPTLFRRSTGTEG